MTTPALVESFQLDHTRVQAPYVRLAGLKQTSRGDLIEKYDLRMVQPNHGALETGVVHTLEHLLAGYLRAHLAGVVDLSPMGCRTGFYLVLLGPVGVEQVLTAFRSTLQDVVNHPGPIPGVSELECGNYRDHDLSGARQWAQKVLDQGLKIQETVEIA